MFFVIAILFSPLVIFSFILLNYFLKQRNRFYYFVANFFSLLLCFIVFFFIIYFFSHIFSDSVVYCITSERSIENSLNNPDNHQNPEIKRSPFPNSMQKEALYIAGHVAIWAFIGFTRRLSAITLF